MEDNKHTEGNDKVVITQDLGKYQQSDFVEKMENTNDFFMFKCPNCGKVHFRHAGYVLTMLPFVAPPVKVGQESEPKVAVTNRCVYVCVACKNSYVEIDGILQDVTKHIDLKAWEKLEKTAHEAVGPGGNC